MEFYGDLQSGNCMKVKLTADLLQVPYTWIPVDIMNGGSRTPEFLRLNPHGQVPVVRLEDGETLAQSNAIIAWLARGSGLLPDDPVRQAKVLEWLFWEQYSHEPYVAVCRFHMHYEGKPKEMRDPVRVERGEAALDAMESHLSTASWMAGDGFTIADIALYAYTHLADEGGFDLDPRPSIRQWINACRNALGNGHMDPSGS
ncbi:MAG: glutathione S-transferase family protein [Pseudomonadota bacterium]